MDVGDGHAVLATAVGLTDQGCWGDVWGAGGVDGWIGISGLGCGVDVGEVQPSRYRIGFCLGSWIEHGACEPHRVSAGRSDEL